MPQPQDERRHHMVYLTRNTEYHCRDRECVGVRDRKTGKWHRWHEALRKELVGGVSKERKVFPIPQKGLRLLFEGPQAVLTSTVEFIGRPQRESVFSYMSFAKSGMIQN